MYIYIGVPLGPPSPSPAAAANESRSASREATEWQLPILASGTGDDASHTRTNRQKAKVVTAVWGTYSYLNVELAIYIKVAPRMIEEKFWKNIRFGNLVVWCGVNQMIIQFLKHPFFNSILQFILFFQKSW